MIWQVDLVHDRDDLEAGVHREIGIREGLSLDALGRVDHEDRALTGVECPGHLVGKIDVARRVDQVQDVLVPVARGVAHAHGLSLDRDAALALQVHLVEELIPLLARGGRFCGVEQAICQRALAVVDVRHDAKVADVLTGRHASPDPPAESTCAK